MIPLCFDKNRGELLNRDKWEFCTITMPENIVIKKVIYGVSKCQTGEEKPNSNIVRSRMGRICWQCWEVQESKYMVWMR